MAFFNSFECIVRYMFPLYVSAEFRTTEYLAVNEQSPAKCDALWKKF